MRIGNRAADDCFARPDVAELTIETATTRSPAPASSSPHAGRTLHGEEDERVVVGRDVQVVDLSYDYPVIAGGVLGDDLALEAGAGVLRRRARRPLRPMAPGLWITSGGRR
jgi:hypothetical protein